MTDVCDPIRCLHIIASLHPSAGGPSRTVLQLADHLVADAGVEVTLLAQSAPGQPRMQKARADLVLRYCESASALALRLGLPLYAGLQTVLHQARPDIIHSHGLWLPVNHWAAAAARNWRLPLVIHPRGMLEPWALQHRGFKKRLALMLFQARDLRGASALVATSHSEYETLRRFGLRQPIAVIPNGLRLPPHLPRPAAARDRSRTLLFLSRIHPVKGLVNLVRAWALLRPQGWRLTVAGPDEGDHLSEVMDEARRLGVIADIDYVGEQDEVRKAAAYAVADIFVLPTFSENFGVVVAEALAHGVPVITTRGAPWADLERHGCGWWVDIGVEPIAEALRQAMALDDADRAAMGLRGRQYVERFEWAGIAGATAELYSWLLGRSGQPSCVIKD